MRAMNCLHFIRNSSSQCWLMYGKLECFWVVRVPDLPNDNQTHSHRGFHFLNIFVFSVQCFGEGGYQMWERFA